MLRRIRILPRFTPAPAHHQRTRAAEPGAQAPHARGAHLPKQAACLRLVTALCVEQSDECVSGRRYLDPDELADGAHAAPAVAGHARPLLAVN